MRQQMRWLVAVEGAGDAGLASVRTLQNAHPQLVERVYQVRPGYTADESDSGAILCNAVPVRAHDKCTHVVHVPGGAQITRGAWQELIDQVTEGSRRSEEDATAIRALKTGIRVGGNQPFAYLALALWLVVLNVWRAIWTFGRLHDGTDVLVHPVEHNAWGARETKRRRCRCACSLTLWNPNTEPPARVERGATWTGTWGELVGAQHTLGPLAWAMMGLWAWVVGVPYWDPWRVITPAFLVRAALNALVVLLSTRRAFRADSGRTALAAVSMPLWIWLAPIAYMGKRYL